MSEFNPAADRLHLQELEVEARIGVTEGERANLQRLVINLTAWCDTNFEQLHDDIDRTINYVEFCRAARELVQSREWKLIETIASELSSHLINKFPINGVEIEVRKFVLPKTAHVSAIIRRTKNT